MPNIEDLTNKPKSSERLLSARRGEILYREDLKTGFVYAIAGISIALAVAGGIYVIGKQLIK
jgi:hypothetical protein